MREFRPKFKGVGQVSDADEFLVTFRSLDIDEYGSIFARIGLDVVEEILRLIYTNYNYTAQGIAEINFLKRVKF